ncbi:conserved hypothetical protein [Candidatus Terasakiella magnetica]|nr:conserved hypothetical protein [Candidatus Terasakiella magnetica]
MSTSIEVAPNYRSSPTDAPVTSQRAAKQHEDNAERATPVYEAARFSSPVIKVDSDTGLALLVVRDSDTGKELDQYPSQKVVEEYQRHQATGPSEVPAASPVPEAATDPASSPAVQVAVAAAAPVPVQQAAPTPAPSAATGGTPIVAPVIID